MQEVGGDICIYIYVYIYTYTYTHRMISVHRYGEGLYRYMDVHVHLHSYIGKDIYIEHVYIQMSTHTPNHFGSFFSSKDPESVAGA